MLVMLCFRCATNMVWCFGISNPRTFCVQTRKTQHIWNLLTFVLQFSLNQVLLFTSYWITWRCFSKLDLSSFWPFQVPTVFSELKFAILCRWKIESDSWKTMLHGPWSITEKLWPWNWYLECWSHSLFLTFWFPSVLGRFDFAL
jgi:hypothetical protein